MRCTVPSSRPPSPPEADTDNTMKRLFGAPSTAVPLPSDSLSRSDTYATQPGPPPSSTSTYTSQRAPLYHQTSFAAAHSTTSQVGSQAGSQGIPHTPSASSTMNGEYFPPTLSLSPIASRHGSSSPYTMSFAAPSQSPTALLMPGQHLVPQATGTSPSLQAQPPLGSTAALADSNAGLTNIQAHAVDRSDLHKSVKAMEGVLVSFDEYRDLKARLAKCEKKLAKGLNELGRAKAFEEVPSQTLQAASDVLEARMDVSTKQAKMIQKEYEATNEHCAKYFKRIAKEEKAFDEQLEALDSKIKKAHASHDKNVKKGTSRSAVESHDKFIQTIQALTADVARLKTAHSASVGQRTFLTSLTVAATMGSLADVEFKSLCESVRKSGQHVGTLHQWLNLTSCEALAKVQPVDVSDDACSGLAQKIAAKETEIREEWQRQEQARFKQLEEEHAILALQQLGWTPPVPAPASTTTPTTERRKTERSGSPSSIERSGTATRSTLPKKTLSHMPTLDSDGNVVEHANVSPQHKAAIVQCRHENEKEAESSTYAHEGRGSSLAEGTVIINDSAAASADATTSPSTDQTTKMVEVESDETNSASSSGMSTSASNSSATSKGSEDIHVELKATGPLTTIEEKADDDAASRHGESRRGEALRTTPSVVGERKSVQPASPSQQTDVQRKSSLWERERERERNAELERRLAEAENRLRTLDHRPSIPRANTATDVHEYNKTPTAKEGTMRSVADSRRPRYSEPMHSVKGYAALPLQQRDEDVHAARQHHEADRYAPAVGSSRIAGQSLSRSLSTDSERSFVARMKAVYQSEKVDKHASLQHAFDAPLTSPRRVSELANTYNSSQSGNNGNARGPPSSSPNVSRTSYSNQQESIRGRYDSAPTETVRRESAAPLGQRRGAESAASPPHASSCGCWHCSGRHYGTGDKGPNGSQGASASMATTRSSVVSPHPTPRHPTATAASHSAPPPNYRRQTMQVPQHIQRDAHAYIEYDRHDRSTLSPPPFRDERQYARRSLDDEPGARFSYPKEHGTVR